MKIRARARWAAAGVLVLSAGAGNPSRAMAQGGSSVVTNWAIVALLIRLSDSARSQYGGEAVPS